jgi:hypothetical protein
MMTFDFMAMMSSMLVTLVPPTVVVGATIVWVEASDTPTLVVTTPFVTRPLSRIIPADSVTSLLETNSDKTFAVGMASPRCPSMTVPGSRFLVLILMRPPWQTVGNCAQSAGLDRTVQRSSAS